MCSRINWIRNSGGVSMSRLPWGSPRRAAERVRHLVHVGFEIDDLLCTETHLMRRLARCPKGFVEGRDLDGLHTPQDKGQRLDRSAHDVVRRLLGRQRHARGVRRDDRRMRTRILRAELLAHHPGKEPPCRADLGDLLEEVHAAVHENGDPASEGVDVNSALT